MSLAHSFRLLFALLFALCSFGVHAQTVHEAQRAGTLKQVNGEVIARATSGEERTVTSGDAIQSGDQLITRANSSASLILRDGTTVVLGPMSQFDLNEFDFNATTQEGSLLASIVKGTMRMITGLIGKNKPESVRITTPTSTIGVLGTDFIVEITETALP